MINTNNVSYYNNIAFHQGLLSKPPAPTAANGEPAAPTDTSNTTVPSVLPVVQDDAKAPPTQSPPSALADGALITLPTPVKDQIDDDNDNEHDDDDHDGARSAAMAGTLLVDSSKETTLQSSFSITTQEGDQVNLSFSRASSSAQTLVSSDGGYVYATSSSNSFAFDINVEGDINDDEKKAIMSLVKKISNIAEKFYQNETQDALHKMDELHFNSEQLSQFSFNINRTSTQSALVSYQNIESYSDTTATTTPASNKTLANPVATTAALAEDINSTVDDIEQNVSALSPHQTLVGIFNAISQLGQFQPQHPNEKVMDFTHFLKKLFHSSEDLNDLGKKPPEKNDQTPALA